MSNQAPVTYALEDIPARKTRRTVTISRFMFVRGRLDYDWLSSDVLGQLLVGWTPNPGTAVYVGYGDYLNYNRFNYRTGRFETGLKRNERVFFVKLSYLFRHTF